MPVYLDRAELAAVLAGLRLLQQALEHQHGLPYGIHGLYTDAGPGLTIPQIDSLCQRLNVANGTGIRSHR